MFIAKKGCDGVCTLGEVTTFLGLRRLNVKAQSVSTSVSRSTQDKIGGQAHRDRTRSREMWASTFSLLGSFISFLPHSQNPFMMTLTQDAMFFCSMLNLPLNSDLVSVLVGGGGGKQCCGDRR